MKKTFCTVLFLLLVSIIMTACMGSPSADQPQLTTKKLHEFYPGDISNADEIQILDGSTGRRRWFADKQQVKEWINRVKDMEFVPDPNQEDRTGFLFEVSLFENEEAKLSFTPNALGGHYYIHNEELLARIQELFQRPDYDDVSIVQMKETSIIVAPPVTDPAASYPAFEILIYEKTIIEGAKQSFQELRKGDRVKVWVNKKGVSKEFAIKIEVED